MDCNKLRWIRNVSGKLELFVSEPASNSNGYVMYKNSKLYNAIGRTIKVGVLDNPAFIFAGKALNQGYVYDQQPGDTAE